MDLVHRRAGALLLALCTIAAGALFGAPRARAATCQPIPVSTIGTDFTIGSDEYRVPAVKNVVLCVDQGFVPIPRVSFDGRGICQFACVSVTIPAGDVDAPGLTISYDVDSAHETRAINPDGVPGTGEACLLSVGGPDAPYTPCPPGVSFGPDIQDPTAGVLPFVQDQIEAVEQTVNGVVVTAQQAAGDAIELAGTVIDDSGALVQLALDTVAGLQASTCAAMPPMYEYDSWGNVSAEVRLCDEPARWAAAAVTALSKDSGAVTQLLLDTVANLQGAACSGIPPMYEYDSWGNVTEVRFCDDPTGWTVALIVSFDDDVRALQAFAGQLVTDLTALTCDAVPPMYEYDPWGNVSEIDFCSEPARWTTAFANVVETTTCAAIPPLYDQYGSETRFCDNPVGWTLIATNAATSVGCAAVPPVYDQTGREIRFCQDPVGWTAVVLRPVVEQICIQPSRCIDPVTIYFILNRLQTRLEWSSSH